jgi:hypothetical protein
LKKDGAWAFEISVKTAAGAATALAAAISRAGRWSCPSHTSMREEKKSVALL